VMTILVVVVLMFLLSKFVPSGVLDFD